VRTYKSPIDDIFIIVLIQFEELVSDIF